FSRGRYGARLTPVGERLVILMSLKMLKPATATVPNINMTNRALVIVGASLATGLGVTFVPDGLAGFPTQVQTILSSGISVGSLCALILNLVLPESEEDKVAVESQESQLLEEEVSSV
ncbi:MAG: hypothetical protein AAFW75_31795, partial [Cyanobacteria bacterium J06636_16]